MGWLNNLFQKSSTNIGLQGATRNTLLRLFGGIIPAQFDTNSQKFIEQGYEGNVDAYSVIKKFADTSSAVPVVVEQRSVDGWEEV